MTEAQAVEQGEPSPLFSGNGYEIRYNPARGKDKQDGSKEEHYQLINTNTSLVEFETSQYPAALEMLFRFEEAIQKITKEYSKLGSIVRVVPKLQS